MNKFAPNVIIRAITIRFFVGFDNFKHPLMYSLTMGEQTAEGLVVAERGMF